MFMPISTDPQLVYQVSSRNNWKALELSLKVSIIKIPSSAFLPRCYERLNVICLVELRCGWQERVFPLRPASAARVFSPVPVPFQTQHHHSHPVLQHYNSFEVGCKHACSSVFSTFHRSLLQIDYCPSKRNFTKTHTQRRHKRPRFSLLFPHPPL
jgi:hypothetical protein